MTDVTPLVQSGQNIIQGYDAQGFIISGQRYDSDVIVSSTRLHPLQEKNLTGLNADDFIHLRNAGLFDMALIGWGVDAPQPLPPHVRVLISEYARTIDLMPTDAACRTYNVLLAEGRKFFALLLR